MFDGAAGETRSSSGRGMHTIYFLNPLLTHNTSEKGDGQKNKYDFHPRLTTVPALTVAVEHSAKQTLKAKKMAAHREKKTVKGPSEAQELDNVDEDEHSDKPNPRYEEELADDEPPQKRRCMFCISDISPLY